MCTATRRSVSNNYITQFCTKLKEDNNGDWFRSTGCSRYRARRISSREEIQAPFSNWQKREKMMVFFFETNRRWFSWLRVFKFIWVTESRDRYDGRKRRKNVISLITCVCMCKICVCFNGGNGGCFCDGSWFVHNNISPYTTI